MEWERPAWHARAACHGTRPDDWFPTRGHNAADVAPLVGLCRTCPVRGDCAAFGLAEPLGLWGGMNRQQRRRLHRDGWVDVDGDRLTYDGATVTVETGDVEVLPWPPMPHPDVEVARRVGLSVNALVRLERLVAARAGNVWAVGDVLVDGWGPPPRPGVMDGSRERLGALAELLACSTSWLVACRLTDAAWPRSVRRLTVAWPVHRDLRAREDRVALLAEFVDECERGDVTPSAARLAEWLEDRAPATSTGGRPKLSPIERVERAAARLSRGELEVLIERLIDRLDAVAA